MSVNWNKCCLLETSEVSIMDTVVPDFHRSIDSLLELWFPYLWFSKTFSKRLLIVRDLTLKGGNAGCGYEVGVDEKYFCQKGFSMENFQSLLRRANRLQSALDRLQQVLSIHSPLRELPRPLRFVIVDCHSEQSPSEDLSVDSYAVVAAAAVLLSLVYLYLTGQADRGGSIPYSSGSLDFRDTYIPIILFHGGYVWIKSRDVARRGVYRREIRDTRGNIIRVVYEPRFKPSHRKGEPSQHIYVGQYDTPEEASILYQITAFCYNGRGGLLQLEDGNSLTIPPMTDSDRSLTGAAKRKCVAAQVRRVYEAFKAEGANAAQPRELAAVCVDHTISVSLNSAGTTCGAPLPVNPTHNSEMGVTPCGDEGFWPSLFTHSPNDLVWEMDFANSPEEGIDAIDAQAFQEGVAASNTQSGMSLSSDNELVRILVRIQQELNFLQRQVQEISETRHQQFIDQQRRDIEQQQRDIVLQQLKAQLTESRNHQCFQPLEPQAFSIQHFQPFQDQLQDLFIDQGMPTSQASGDHSSNDPFRYLMNA